MHKHIQLKSAFLFALLFSTSLVLAQKQTYQNLQEALFSRGKLSGGSGPRNINWIDNGNKFSYVKTNPQDGTQEIRTFIPKTKSDTLVFDGADLTFPNSEDAFEYSAFQWSKDSKYILFKSNFRKVWRNSGISDYYFYSLADKTLKLVAKDAQTAELSPNGKMIGYERGGNMFVYDFASKKETQLTDDASEFFYNGRYGWAYEEEFGLAQAWDWSPDSKNIAFWQTDEKQVPIFQMTDYSNEQKEYVKLKYPEVGDTNPIVRIGVLNIANKTKKWMAVDLDGGYIPRIYWTAQANKLAIVHLNRKQNHLTLTMHDTKTGEGKKIMEEKSDAWVDVFDFFAGINHFFFFPKDVSEFFWISDRNGWSHIYRYDYSGKLLTQVTKGDWEVVRVENVDSKSRIIYYTSTENSPLDRHLYSIKFDGSGKKKITKEAGRHNLNLSPNSKYFVDSYSNVNNPKQVELCSTKGKLIKKFEENKAVSEFVSSHAYAPRELMQFTTTDGQKLDIYVVKPFNFDPNKSYPLLLNIYGGPGAQSVYNQFGTSTWEQFLAQEGYVIASVNNRGSGGYGSKFEKVVYKNLGHWEAHDFVETVNYLAKKPWVDGDRMAIRGHSYGGYMSSYTMLNHPDVFKVAIVGAPVTDWRLYDSIYAERYMGLEDENEEGYLKSASTTSAGNLEGKMLLVHSTMDENVHVKNTFQLVTALIDNGKDVDLRIYPPGAHGVAYSGPSFVLLYTQYQDYLDKYLKGE